MARLRIAAVHTVLALPAVLSTPTSSSSSTPAQNTPTAAPTYVGCFSSFKPLIKQDTYQYQSSGHCWGVCSDLNKPVLGLSDGISCWCGDELPVADSKVTESHCSTPCQGYNLEDCGGGTNFFTIWLTGTESTVPYYNSSDKSQSAAPTSTSTQSSTNSASATASSGASAPSSTLSPTDKKLQRIRSHHKQQTILGVVLGLTAFTALAMFGLILWCCCWRRRKRPDRSLRRSKASSLSKAPLAAGVDGASIDSASTYSSQRSVGFVERTGHAIAAMQVALNPNARNNSKRVSPGIGPVEIPPGQGRNERLSGPELHAQDGERNEDLQPARKSYPPYPYATPALYPVVDMGQQNFKQPKSVAVVVSSDELVSPTSPSPVESSRKQHRSLMIHYPSWSEVNGFDFAGESDDTMVGRQRGSWHSWRERKDGRYELA